jgi:hypothetical protein
MLQKNVRIIKNSYVPKVSKLEKSEVEREKRANIGTWRG